MGSCDGRRWIRGLDQSKWKSLKFCTISINFHRIPQKCRKAVKIVYEFGYNGRNEVYREFILQETLIFD